MANIVNTALDIINQRIFPKSVRSYDVRVKKLIVKFFDLFLILFLQHWNNLPYSPTFTNRMQVYTIHISVGTLLTLWVGFLKVIDNRLC